MYNRKTCYLLCFIIFSIIFSYSCLKIIPERTQVTYINNKYLAEIISTVRRSKRGGEYVLNVCVTSKYPFGYNLSMDFIFYEYLHNEYRRSFVEVHFNLCDLILKDSYIGAVLRNQGLVACPAVAKKYCLLNMTFDKELPSVWPFEKGKAELIATFQPSGEIIGKGELMMLFKQKLPRLTKSLGKKDVLSRQ